MTQKHKSWQERINVCILTHNRRETLYNQIRLLIEMGFQEEEIIIIDNGSSDGTCEMLTQCYPKVNLIGLRNNEGTYAWNYGFVRSSKEIILVLDDDAIPAEDSAEEALQLFDTLPDVGIVACWVSNYQDGNIWDTPYQPPEIFNTTDHFIFIGCAYFVRRSLVCDGKVFDPNITIADHEYPLAIRCFQDGWRIVYHPKVRALHRFDDPQGEHKKGDDSTIILRAKHAAYFCFCTGGLFTKMRVALWLFLRWVYLIKLYHNKPEYKALWKVGVIKFLLAFIWGLYHSLKSSKLYWPAPIIKTLVIWEDFFLNFENSWFPWDKNYTQIEKKR